MSRTSPDPLLDRLDVPAGEWTQQADGLWTVRRDTPGFNQRFRGTVEDGGRLVGGAWEASANGTTWQVDFGHNYRRIG